MTQPTNKKLADQIQAVNNRVEKQHKSMLTSLNTFKNEVWDYVRPLHDYIEGEKGYQRGVKENKAGGISITPDVIKIILWLIAIIAALVGVTSLPK